MKKIIEIEELALTIAAIYLIYTLHIGLSWWVYVLLFFSPDIGMIGYLLNNKSGAVIYNLFHHRAAAIIVAGIGYYLLNDYLILAGLIMLAHASFDRIFGFGLKYYTGFKHTHLGVMK
ncbi:MAG: DUF4260 domain-containing protein [Chitinophagales bacterium]|nr:DUF4260 domain-containing protein [Chitinophagales bacterium]